MALALAIILATSWGSLALWFQAGQYWRIPLMLGWCALGLLAAASPWLRSRTAIQVTAVVALMALLAWWHTLAPSHDRIWADDVARLMQAEVHGNRLTIHNVRNFEWQSESDYIAQWETREYDLDKLESADLLLSYWMGPAIAHTLVSFGFSDGRQLVLSLEIRKESHEAFSAIAGFFRQYETIIIAADENDIVRVRTNIRGETVHMYRLALTPDALRTALLGYMQAANDIRDDARFYNTLTSNCTTIVFDLARQLSPGLPLDHRLLLSGYFAEYAYDHHGLQPGFDFAALEANSDITPAARAYQGEPDGFPSAIRQHLIGATAPAASAKP